MLLGRAPSSAWVDLSDRRSPAGLANHHRRPASSSSLVRVARTAPSPTPVKEEREVAAAAPTPTPRARRFLVCAEGPEDARQALRFASAHLWRQGDDVIHVAHVDVRTGGESDGGDASDGEEAAARFSRQLLAASPSPASPSSPSPPPPRVHVVRPRVAGAAPHHQEQQPPLRSAGGQQRTMPVWPAAKKAAVGAALVAVAERLEADAVVVASGARGGLGEALAGSVATYLRRHTHVPLAVVRPDAASAGAPSSVDSSSTTTRLVVALNDSDEAEAALRWALAQTRADVVALHILPVVSLAMSAVGPAAAASALAPDGFVYASAAATAAVFPDADALAARQREAAEALARRFGGDLVLLPADTAAADAAASSSSSPPRARLEVLADFNADSVDAIAHGLVGRCQQLGAAALVVGSGAPAAATSGGGSGSRGGATAAALNEAMVGSVAAEAARRAWPGLGVVVLHPT